MSNIFKEGGTLNITNTGKDTYRASVDIPKDPTGRLGRECANEDCSPAYFKVLPGTGITENHALGYCPYCRTSAPPEQFSTDEQVRYAKDMVLREAMDGVHGMLKSALGLGQNGRKKIGGGFLSIEMSLKPSPRPHVRRPFEEEVRRDLICPHCGLDHSVYGLAIWCPDCGKDIFVSHIAAEVSVVRTMLTDVPRRRESLGRRIAAKDIENCLEDAVSIMEAVLRALTRRALFEGEKAGEVDAFFKRIGNAFQNVDRTRSILSEDFHIELGDALSVGALDSLKSTFEKRHPIAHNTWCHRQEIPTKNQDGRRRRKGSSRVGGGDQQCSRLPRDPLQFRSWPTLSNFLIVASQRNLDTPARKSALPRPNHLNSRQSPGLDDRLSTASFAARSRKGKWVLLILNGVILPKTPQLGAGVHLVATRGCLSLGLSLIHI